MAIFINAQLFSFLSTADSGPLNLSGRSHVSQPYPRQIPFPFNPVVSPTDFGRNRQVSETTALNTRSAVSIFERWLFENFHPEVATKYEKIEEIPVEELDEYLSQFWPTVKKQNGADYQVESLVQLRTRLDRHLRHAGYSQSIVKSQCFARSQKAFKERAAIITGSRSAHLTFAVPSTGTTAGQETVEQHQDSTTHQ